MLVGVAGHWDAQNGHGSNESIVGPIGSGGATSLIHSRVGHHWPSLGWLSFGSAEQAGVTVCCPGRRACSAAR